MATTASLQGIALIDCAKANALQGPQQTARFCGYSDDVDAFQNL